MCLKNPYQKANATYIVEFGKNDQQKNFLGMNKAYFGVAKTFNLRNTVVKFAASPVQVLCGTNCIFTRHCKYYPMIIIDSVMHCPRLQLLPVNWQGDRQDLNSVSCLPVDIQTCFQGVVGNFKNCSSSEIFLGVFCQIES